MRTLFQLAFAISLLAVAPVINAQQSEKRIALVIGNAAYQAEALPTSANDAGLIAQTLQAAGFDVVGARDLDQDTLRRTFRDFLDKASASGPDTVAFVYLSGYGVQLEGENYFVPIDARIARDTDVSAEAVRMSDYTRPLAALKLKANIIVLDAARSNPFAKSGQPLASGLSLSEPDKGMLVAFNAAPGTVAPQEKGPYSAYAQALAEMIRTGGLPIGDVFNRVRLRVNEMTKGGEVPWNASKIEAPIVFFDRSSDAPPPTVSNDQVSSVRSKPIREFDAQDAYVAALERDTLQGYLDFLAAYPSDPMAHRVRAIVAARREAITWRRTRVVDTPQAYWSYLRRYSRGPHVTDARRRLAYLSAAFEPPQSFTVISYDVGPPPEEEVIYFRRPVLFFDDPEYGFAPPPPPPEFFLAPPPPEFIVLAPPPPVFGIFVLPVPNFVPVPTYYNPPAYVAPPPPNVIYNNIHNTVVINNTANTVTITNPSGQAQTLTPAQALSPQAASATSPPSPAVAPAATPGAPGTPSRTLSPGAAVAVGAAAGAGAALLAPSLPPSVAKKATAIQTQNPLTTPSATNPAAISKPSSPGSSPVQQPAAVKPGQPGASTKPAAQSLPGSGGQPLPQINGKPIGPSQAQPAGSLTPGTAQSGQPAGAVQPTNKPAAQSLPGSNGQPLPQRNGKPAVPIQTQPSQNQIAPPASPAAQPAKPIQPPARGLPTPPSNTKPSNLAPAPASPAPPAAVRAPPPAARPAPPSPRAAPPPAAARPAPPPPRAAPPPAAARPAPPPPRAAPPPAAARPAPPPPRAAPPPAAARPAPPPPAAAAKPKPCVLPNGAACPEKK